MVISLEAQHYQVVAASNVPEARGALEGGRWTEFDAVVTDYRMPGEDGLSLMAWLRQQDPTLATIMVTAEGEKHLVAESLRGGAHDFLDKPINVADFVTAVSQACHTTLHQRQLRSAECAIRQVAGVQHALVRMHAGVLQNRIDICFFPKQEAGGDFVSVFPIGQNRLLVLATDVSGHDLRAAFISSYFQGIVRGMLEQHAGIGDIFRFFNRFLVEEWNRPGNWGADSHIETSMAACAVCLDLSAGHLEVLDCGFPAPLYIDGQGEVVSLLKEGSTPLGWFLNPELAGHTRELTEREGSVVAWSDGLEDLAAKLDVDPHSLAYRLHSAKKLSEDVTALLSDAQDDVMAIHFNVGHEAGSSVTAPQLLLYQPVLGGTEDQIDAYQLRWERSLKLAMPALGEERSFAILLCAREAMLNAIKHGCAGLENVYARIQITLFPSKNFIQLRVDDPGPGHDFDFDSYEQRASDELLTEHRGLILIKHLCDQLITRRRGASMTMLFHLQPASAQP
jgi:CheY-like chemotaxis protein/anti-sigma regulatory factor (Ser/Thr protein kinase)